MRIDAPQRSHQTCRAGTGQRPQVSIVSALLIWALAGGAAWGGTLPSTIAVASPAFATGVIPTEFTCDGANQSPQVRWTALPPAAKSAAIVLDDPDAPSGDFHHWLIYNLPPGVRSLPANLPKTPTIPGGGSQGRNDRGAIGYTGPCPPPGPPHHYRLTLYALSRTLKFNSPPEASALDAALKGSVIATARITATFRR